MITQALAKAAKVPKKPIKLEIKSPDGRTYEFTWNKETDPTDADIQNALAKAKKLDAGEAVPATQYEKPIGPTLKEDLFAKVLGAKPPVPPRSPQSTPGQSLQSLARKAVKGERFGETTPAQALATQIINSGKFSAKDVETLRNVSRDDPDGATTARAAMGMKGVPDKVKKQIGKLTAGSTQRQFQESGMALPVDDPKQLGSTITEIAGKSAEAIGAPPIVGEILSYWPAKTFYGLSAGLKAMEGDIGGAALDALQTAIPDVLTEKIVGRLGQLIVNGRSADDAYKIALSELSPQELKVVRDAAKQNPITPKAENPSGLPPNLQPKPQPVPSGGADPTRTLRAKGDVEVASGQARRAYIEGKWRNVIQARIREANDILKSEDLTRNQKADILKIRGEWKQELASGKPSKMTEAELSNEWLKIQSSRGGGFPQGRPVDPAKLEVPQVPARKFEGEVPKVQQVKKEAPKAEPKTEPNFELPDLKPAERTKFHDFTFTKHLSEEGSKLAESVYAQMPTQRLTISQMRANANDFASKLKPKDVEKLKSSGRSYEEVGGLLEIGDNAADQAAGIRTKLNDPIYSEAEQIQMGAKADELELLAFEAYEKAAPGITGAGRVLRFLQERPNKDSLNPDYLMRLADRAARRSGADGAPKPVKKKIANLSVNIRAKQALLDQKEVESQLGQLPKQPVVRASYGDGNKFVTKATFEADVKTIRQKLGQASMNPFADYELIQSLTRVVAYHVEAGVRSSAELFTQVKSIVGDKVSDSDVWKIVKQGTGKYASQANKGRIYGKDVQVSGQQGMIDPSVGKLRAEIDDLRGQIAHEIAQLDKPGFWERTRLRHRAFRVGNPIARVKDLVGNQLVRMERGVHSPLKAGLDRILFPKARKTEGAANVGPSVQQMQMVAKGASGRIWGEIKRQMGQGDPRILHKYEIFRELPEAKATTIGAKVAALNPLGNKALNRVSRFAGTTDIPFKDAAFRGTLAELSIARARMTGGTKDEIRDRAADIFRRAMDGDEEFADMYLIADNEALQTTFMGENVFTNVLSRMDAGMIQQLGDKAHGLLLLRDIVATFPRIFSNIQGYATDNVFGALKAAGKVASVKRAGIPLGVEQRRQINQLVARNMTGLATFAAGYHVWDWATKNPDDPKAKELLGAVREVNKKSAYVDFGDYGSVGGPVALFLLGATWNITETAGMTDKQRAKFQWNTAIGILADQPAIEGPKRLLEQMQTPGGAAKYGARLGMQAIIPAAVREWARRQDAMIKTGNFGGRSSVKTEGPLDEVKAQIPFQRESLPSK